MIKQYGSHLIPERKSPLAYDILVELPRGSDFHTPMYLKSTLQLSIRYYHMHSRVEYEFFDYTDFNEYLKFTLPKVTYARSFPMSFWFFNDIPHVKHYFRSKEHAYIDMFLNSSNAKRLYPDIHQQILQQYPEYFI
jgi:hypothetical protein